MTTAGVTFDAVDATRLAAWWAKAVGGEVTLDSDGWFCQVAVPGSHPLSFQKVADVTPGKNKIHLDFQADDPAVEIERLIALEAEMVGEHTMEGFSWTVLADPEGNQFCVSG
ncbi:MAG: VOC family protein [Propionibacteriaceae bacterium]|jgi:hypothetical protein|nr:VOC family protein [Propionibacteriaceae bacterium]